MMKRILFGWAMSIGLSVLALPTHAAELRIVSWNIEGGGFEDAEVATITANMDRLGHADIWGLSEVTAAWVNNLRDAAGSNYHAQLGTQASDRLLVLVNLNRFEVTGSEEIRNHNPTANRRPPLAVTVRERATGTQLIYVVNHLTRGTGDDPRRREEAEALREWARQQTLPIIAGGDFNFDWSIHDHGHTRPRAIEGPAAGCAQLSGD
jgi:endonuclease/exonuclease/phosphatase (EEP) superfamily protein YafD